MQKKNSFEFQRARLPKQIEYRRMVILQSALTLFRKKGLEEVTLKDIGHEVGTAKSNLYRYFNSREHIYLTILQAEGLAWEQRLLPPLQKLAGKGTTAKIAAILTQSFLQSVDYCQLCTAINSLFEKNLSPTLIANFRAVAYERRICIAHAIATALPRTSTETIYPLILPIISHMILLWSLCHPPPAAKELLRTAEFSHLHHDFKKEMSSFIEVIFKGALDR